MLCLRSLKWLLRPNYRSLSKAGLIDNQEAKRLFDVVELNGQDIELLNKSDIDHIKLKFN